MRGYRPGRRAVSVGAIVIALFASAAALWRSGVFAPALADPLARVKLSAENGQKIYRSFAVEPVFSDIARIRDVVAHAPRSELSASVDVPIDSLLDLFAEFMYYRIGQPSVDEYIRWRIDRGYKWKLLEQLNSFWYAESDYAWYFPDKELPPNPTPEYLFRDFWGIGLDLNPAANRPAAMCVEDRGLRVSFSIATPGNPRNSPRLGEDSDEMIWHGASSTGGRCWFDPPRSREVIMAEEGRVLVGQVAAIVEYQGGSRCPLVVSAIWDRKLNRWMMTNIILRNRYVEGESSVEY